MTTDRPQSTIYSPDGYYWWDGTEWRLVEQPPAQRPDPPAQQVPPAQQHPAARQPGPATSQWGAQTAPWGAPAPQWGAPVPPKPSPGIHPAVLVGLVVVVGLLAGLALGSNIGSARSVANVGPVTLPAVPEEFPGDGERHLDGLALTPITDAWAQAVAPGQCAPNPELTRLSGAAEIMVCEVGSWGDLQIEYDDENHVRRVDANCTRGPGSTDCQDLFVFLANVVFPNDQALQQQARDWVAANVDSDLSTTIGPVHLSVRLEPHRLGGTPAL